MLNRVYSLLAIFRNFPLWHTELLYGSYNRPSVFVVHYLLKRNNGFQIQIIIQIELNVNPNWNKTGWASGKKAHEITKNVSRNRRELVKWNFLQTSLYLIRCNYPPKSTLCCIIFYLWPQLTELVQILWKCFHESNKFVYHFPWTSDPAFWRYELELEPRAYLVVFEICTYSGSTQKYLLFERHTNTFKLDNMRLDFQHCFCSQNFLIARIIYLFSPASSTLKQLD